MPDGRYKVKKLVVDEDGSVLQVSGPDDFSFVETQPTLAECVESLAEEIGKYDSEAETRKHMQSVSRKITNFATTLLKRGASHDLSKLEPVEKKHFDTETPKLKYMPYGSDAYNESLARLKPALDHHYRVNSHHPEHWKHGVNGMDLLDLVEMVMDWKAANERGSTSFADALKVSFKRFNVEPQLQDIIVNTAYRLGWLVDDEPTETGLIEKR